MDERLKDSNKDSGEQDINSPVSQEEIYQNLNKIVSDTLVVIRRALWPLVIIIIVFAAIFGYRSFSDLGKLQELSDEIFEKRNEVNDIIYKIRDERIEISETQLAIRDEQEKLRDEIAIQMAEIEKLSNRTKEVTEKGDELLTDIQKNTNDLLSRSDEQLSAQNNLLEENRSSIESALKGITEKETLLEELKKEREEELEKIRKINSLFVTYYSYVISGQNIFPDPYLKEELEILNEIVDILYENPQDKNNFIKKINSIIQQ